MKQKHLSLLKQGANVWNKWRDENPSIKPDLSQTELRNLKLHDTNFSHTDLAGCDFYGTSLHGSDFSFAYLGGTAFVGTVLSGTKFFQAEIYGTQFIKSLLHGANFSNSRMRDAVFCDVDISLVEGLDKIIHLGSSTIGIDTMYKSGGHIPKDFLRGTGTPENFIDQIIPLASWGIQMYHSCFISYSNHDENFVKKLHSDLLGKGVRCWFAPEDMKIGERIRSSIDKSINKHDKLLLVLSKHSIASQWVEKEVETAFELESRQGQTILFPIRIDHVVMDTEIAWAADIRRTRHIGDFTHWGNTNMYGEELSRLLSSLKKTNQQKRPNPNTV